jgi:hypothetical protein
LLFDIPADFLRAFNRDLRATGIPKRDVRGRTVDIRSLRLTFCTPFRNQASRPASPNG